jgi:hypothetical protein
VLTLKDGNVLIAAISQRTLINKSSAIMIATIDFDDPIFLKLSKYAVDILRCLECEAGISHIEVIVDEMGNVFPIDIAFRGGGYWVADRIMTRTLGVNPTVAHVNDMCGIKQSVDIYNYNKKAITFEFPNFNCQIFEMELIDKGFKCLDVKKLTPIYSANDAIADGSRNQIKYWERENGS